MARNIYTISLLLFLFLISTGCQPEQVEFIKIDNPAVLGTEGHYIRIEADAILFNPNKTRGKVKEIDIVVSFKEQQVAHVQETSSVQVGAEQQFVIPLSMLLDMEKIQSNWLSNLVSILREKSLELHFSGYIKIKIHGIGYRVPVNYTERINL